MANLLHSLKIPLISTGVVFVFVAILLAFSFPGHLLGSATSFDFPTLWFGVQAWLRPPYLYFIINGIIITIVASSRFHHHHHAPEVAVESMRDDHQHDVIRVVRAELFSSYGVVSVKDSDVEVVRSEPEISDVGGVEAREDGSWTVVKTATWTAVNLPAPLERQKPVEISPELRSENPPSCSRFGQHRRPAKANPAEGVKALRVAKSTKKQDTLESTWRTITEGRHIPLTRHLMKKSDTWDNDDRRQINLLDDSFLDPPVKKSETFKDRTNYAPPRVPKLKKDPSLGQDELNRRVEAFINKVNADMKLQREQSIQQFMEKINRGAY